MKKVFKKSIAFVLTLALALTSLVVMNTTEVKAANNYKYFLQPASSSDIKTLQPGANSEAFAFNVDVNAKVYVAVVALYSDTITASIFNEAGALVDQKAITVEPVNANEDPSGYAEFALAAGNYSVVLTSTVGNYIYLFVGRDTAAISQQKAEVTVGFNTKLDVTGGTVKAWKSSNKGIATVDKKGKVTGKKAGRCKITAVLTTGEKLTCTVTVKKNVYSTRKLTTSDVYYGNSAANVYNMSYDKKGNLVVRVRFVNNIGYKVVKLNKMKIVVKNSAGKVIGVYSGSQKLSVAHGGAKDFKVTIKKSKLKIKKVQDLVNAEATIDGESIYSVN